MTVGSEIVDGVKMNKQELAQIFVKRLEEERIKRGWKQYEVAERLGMSLPGYRKMIAGHTESISLYTAFMASTLFDMSMLSFCAESTRMEIIDKLQKVPDSVCDRVNYYLTNEEKAYQFYRNLQVKQKVIDVLKFPRFMKDGMQIDSYLVEKHVIKDIFDEEIHKGIYVSENSYIPVYGKGDILLINENMARNGDITLLLHAKTRRFYLRKLLIKDEFECHPINGRGEIFVIPQAERKEWIDCGHVVAAVYGEKLDLENE